MTRPFNRIIEAVAAIATAMGATVVDTGNRLADNLEGISKVVGGGGTGGGVLIVAMDMATYTLDKTYAEIVGADFAVVKVVENGSGMFAPLYQYGVEESVYYLQFAAQGRVISFVTDAEDGYPVMDGGGGGGDDGPPTGGDPSLNAM